MKINFGGVAENIVTRKEFPLKKAQKVLKGRTVAVLGYGIQGPAQALLRWPTMTLIPLSRMLSA